VLARHAQELAASGAFRLCNTLIYLEMLHIGALPAGFVQLSPFPDTHCPLDLLHRT
jgi:hypothetical protein